MSCGAWKDEASASKRAVAGAIHPQRPGVDPSGRTGVRDLLDADRDLHPCPLPKCVLLRGSETLSPRKLRRALLEEGGHPLALILGREREGEGVELAGEVAREVPLEGEVDDLLGERTLFRGD